MTGTTAAWYGVLVPVLFGAALWVSTWWQLHHPAEDFSVEPLVWFGCVGGALLGLVAASSGWNWRTALAVAIIAAAVWPAVFVLVFGPPLVILFVPGGLLYWLARSAAKGDPAWRRPLAVALTPLFIASLAVMPPLDSYKWLWPWSALRGRILEFQAQSDAAADRLHIPLGQPLSRAELDSWSAAAPLRLSLPYPIVGNRVVISVVHPWSRQRLPRGRVWAWWGDPREPTFGELDVFTMKILSAGD